MSPRTKKQFEEIREEKKTLIMDVALEHFATEGYFKTTISHIAYHAGISKGLMYNYFDSKETLLQSIISRSVQEVYSYFDMDNDGYLSEEEFDFFVRKVSQVLKEKQSFWRLMLQIMMQKEVREQLQVYFLELGAIIKPGIQLKPGLFASDFMKIITDYFIRKKERKGPGYDPYLDLNMFLLTLKGFTLKYIYMDNTDDAFYKKMIEGIIEYYK
jgi:AcrR family transcriptional regulator